MKYRAEIDGLRALAVVPVILFHAGFELFSGGFVGVDVFFVISGYLITTILVDDIENKRFSIVHFYERRARRILPALFFVMVVCLPFAWMWMSPSQIKDFSQSLIAVSLFASNILFWRESDYFAAAAEEKPLLHTWSLAVEEQYYVLFPVFLILTWRFGRNRVFWMIVVVAAISLLLSEWGWRSAASANFYLAHTRAWELLSGSIAAFIVQRRGVKKNNALALSGFAAIVFSIFVYDESIPFPSLYTLAPVLGVVLLILYADKETLVAKLLGTRPFVGIGLISYSAYLWHQPLFAFATIRQAGFTSDTEMIILSLASLFLAYFSWNYIESPFRDRRIFGKKKIFLFSFLGIFTFISIGLLGLFKGEHIGPGKHNPYHNLRTLNLGSYVSDNKLLQKNSWDLLRKISNNEKYTVENNEFDDELWFDLSVPSERLLIIGNSHSKDIFNILSQSETFSKKFQVARYGSQIRDLNEDHKLWGASNYLSGTHILIASRYSDLDLRGLSEVIEKMLHDGKSVFLASNIFEFPGNAASYSLIDKIVLENKNLDAHDVADLINKSYFRYYKSSLKNHSEKINKELAEIASNFKIPVLNRMDYVCNEVVAKCFAVDNDLSKNFYDYGHHTLSGSLYFSKSDSLPRFLDALAEF